MGSSLYLIFGEDSFKKERFFQDLKAESLKYSDEKLNYDRLEGDKIDFNRLQDTVERVPFLGDKRLILIEKASYIFGGKPGEKILDYLESYMQNPLSSNVLVFMADKVDKRSRLYKKIKAAGEVIQFDNPKAREVEKIVKNKIASLGLKFEDEAIHRLLQNTNGDLNLIEQELDKLSVAEEGVISAETVDKYVSSSLESNIFKFVDKIGEENVEPALKHLKELLLNEPIQRVYFMICRQFRLLCQVKIMVQEGYTDSELSKQLKLPPFVVKKLMSQAKKFSLEDLTCKVIELVDIDYKLKTSSVVDDKYILEKIVIEAASDQSK